MRSGVIIQKQITKTAIIIILIKDNKVKKAAPSRWVWRLVILKSYILYGDLYIS
jgi:hypothetical protein